MAWVCVNSFGTELIFETEPHKAVYSWRDDYGSCKCIEIPQGSIKKLIGRELTWNDEPVELNKNNMIFYRFGEIPKNEKSCIWKGEEKVGEEFGVSVYEAHKNINGTYSPVLPMPVNMSTLDTFLHFIRYYNGKKYLVTGDVLPFVGTDWEPLIKNVKILKEL